MSSPWSSVFEILFPLAIAEWPVSATSLFAEWGAKGQYVKICR
jgi:hypothetical protein